METLEEKDLLDKVNLIITSDHGMTNITNVVNVSQYLDIKDESIQIVESDAYLSLNVLGKNPGKLDEVPQHLKNMPHGAAYKKEDFPAKFRYSNHSRIPQLIVLGNEGTFYQVLILSVAYAGKYYGGEVGGSQGYGRPRRGRIFENLQKYSIAKIKEKFRILTILMQIFALFSIFIGLTDFSRKF